MQAPRYDSVSVALYDPVAMNRNATRNVLYSLGFREIEGYAALDDLRKAMGQRDFDLVMLEVAREDDPIYDFVKRLRRSEVPCNPFALVVASTWLPHARVVKQVLDSGADDLVCRPFSVNVLGERLLTHVHARKGFVVTSDYVGPDRRTDATRPNSARLIPVANSVRLKAVEGKSGFEARQIIQSEVAAARRNVTLERMRRMAFQIGVIAGFVSGQAENPAETVRRSDLEKIASMAEALLALAGQQNAEQAVSTSQTILDVANKSLEGNDLATNAKIMVRLSVALQVALTPGGVAEQFHAELDQTLERIRARGRVA